MHACLLLATVEQCYAVRCCAVQCSEVLYCTARADLLTGLVAHPLQAEVESIIVYNSCKLFKLSVILKIFYKILAHFISTTYTIIALYLHFQLWHCTFGSAATSSCL